MIAARCDGWTMKLYATASLVVANGCEAFEGRLAAKKRRDECYCGVHPKRNGPVSMVASGGCEGFTKTRLGQQLERKQMQLMSLSIIISWNGWWFTGMGKVCLGKHWCRNSRKVDGPIAFFWVVSLAFRIRWSTNERIAQSVVAAAVVASSVLSP